MEDKFQRTESLSKVFVELGCQYYAIARYSASKSFAPIYSTMFHHAVEMLLKGYLVKFRSIEDLKKIGHKLPELWMIYKEILDDNNLVRFDKTIQDLDRVELLRYPNAIVDEGFVLNVRLGVPSPLEIPDLNNQPQYFINVSDLDEIALSVFESCKVNPKTGFKNTPAELVWALPPNFKPWE